MPVAENDSEKNLVTPVMRGMRLLRYIAEGGSTANLSEVGRLIDVNRVTVMRLLTTLEHEGLIERRRVGMLRDGCARGLRKRETHCLAGVVPVNGFDAAQAEQQQGDGGE